MCKSYEAVCRRAGGRRHYNSVRTCRRLVRRLQLTRWLLAEGMGWGTQARAARALGVSEATISRDLAALTADWRARWPV